MAQQDETNSTDYLLAGTFYNNKPNLTSNQNHVASRNLNMHN
jgi:hypothetical protein